MGGRGSSWEVEKRDLSGAQAFPSLAVKVAEDLVLRDEVWVLFYLFIFEVWVLACPKFFHLQL